MSLFLLEPPQFSKIYIWVKKLFKSTFFDNSKFMLSVGNNLEIIARFRIRVIEQKTSYFLLSLSLVQFLLTITLKRH